MQANQQVKRETLLLTREAIAETMQFADYVAAVESAFRHYAAGTIAVPEVVHMPGDGGAFHVKSAALTDGPRYTAVKVNGNFPDNRQRHGLPTIQGAIILCDGNDGFPLALMDSIEVTAQRTAAATAVAAKYLARPDCSVATVIGCGLQGGIQLEALLHILPIEKVYAFDTDQDAARAFAQTMTARFKVPVTAVGDFAEAARTSDAIVTCTSSRRAFLTQEHIKPGTFIAAVGADNDDKQELRAGLVASSKLVVDILEQCAHIGELHHALEQKLMAVTDVYANLGEIVSGKKASPVSASGIVIFDSTGSAIQDVAAAGVIYERALEQKLGTAVNLA